jgi:hypothetical protein
VASGQAALYGFYRAAVRALDKRLEEGSDVLIEDARDYFQRMAELARSLPPTKLCSDEEKQWEEIDGMKFSEDEQGRWLVRGEYDPGVCEQRTITMQAVSLECRLRNEEHPGGN